MLSCLEPPRAEKNAPGNQVRARIEACLESLHRDAVLLTGAEKEERDRLTVDIWDRAALPAARRLQISALSRLTGIDRCRQRTLDMARMVLFYHKGLITASPLLVQFAETVGGYQDAAAIPFTAEPQVALEFEASVMSLERVSAHYAQAQHAATPPAKRRKLQ